MSNQVLRTAVQRAVDNRVFTRPPVVRYRTVTVLQGFGSYGLEMANEPQQVLAVGSASLLRLQWVGDVPVGTEVSTYGRTRLDITTSPTAQTGFFTLRVSIVDVAGRVGQRDIPVEIRPFEFEGFPGEPEPTDLTTPPGPTTAPTTTGSAAPTGSGNAAPTAVPTSSTPVLTGTTTPTS